MTGALPLGIAGGRPSTFFSVIFPPNTSDHLYVALVGCVVELNVFLELKGLFTLIQY